MAVEVRPFGVKCNIGCQYCYQNPERDAGNDLRSYDMDLMMQRLKEDGRKFILFGGEPLLMPLADLEEIWRYGFERFGSNGIQTNGTLITGDHIDLFRRYKVHVGMSLDGPGELNDVRWAGSLSKTREATEKSHEAIRMLCEEGMPPSLIVTLSRSNATADKLERMKDWFREMDRQGVVSARLHLMEVESEDVRDKYTLTTEENIAAVHAFQALGKELKGLQFDMFKDMRKMLLGQDKSNTCVWTGCDPYTTSAVQGLEGNGQRSNCGRTNKDGVDFVKADKPGWERYVALYFTPQEFGGCQGCRFFLMCKGQCPGTSLQGDWRSRTEHCEVIKGLYRKLEEELLDEGTTPLSAHPVRQKIEGQMVEAWMHGQHYPIAHFLDMHDRDSSTRPSQN